MKLTNKQVEVIDTCISQLGFWKSTNDINSPTHFCDIDSDFSNLYFDDKITDEESNKLICKLSELLILIRNL